MTNQLVTVDAATLALRQDLERQWDHETAFLTLDPSGKAHIAPTIFLAKRGGGTGASTFCLVLEYLLAVEALIIEVGGNSCAAFRDRGPDRHRHFASREQDRVGKALNARLDNAGRIAILEFEPSLFRDTVKIAASMKAIVDGATVILFYLTSRHETASSYRQKALENGLHQVFMCQQPTRVPDHRTAETIYLPWLDPDILDPMHAEALSLQDSLRKCSGLWTKGEARLNLAAFANTISESRAP